MGHRTKQNDTLGDRNASRPRLSQAEPHPRAPQGDVRQHGFVADRARADQDDAAEGEGTEADRRQDHHPRQARRPARPPHRRTPSSSRTPRSRSSSRPSGPATRSARAATPASSRPASATATPPRWRSSSSSTATPARRAPATRPASPPRKRRPSKPARVRPAWKGRACGRVPSRLGRVPGTELSRSRRALTSSASAQVATP